jgi:hypothetical protein
VLSSSLQKSSRERKVSEFLPTILEFAEDARATTFGKIVLLHARAALSIRNINAV